jgi:aldose 1-epimerase
LCILNHEYQLDINDGLNHLHGGRYGGSNQLWSVDSCNDTAIGQEITLSLELPDGLCGYPGNRHFTTSFLLINNLLKISYKVTTDQPTWASMSNHSYWNLSGDFTRSALNHTLQIRSDRVIYNDKEHLPMEICGVDNTPFDFRMPVKISDNIILQPYHKQLKNALGYNNAYLLGRENLPCAVLSDPDSGRLLRIYTDQPALVFYSGGYLDSQTQLKNGLSAVPSCALALEAQDLPDAPNFSGEAFHILTPGETWHHEIIYEFDCGTSL